MSATKNPLYAAVGAGATAFEAAKGLPQRVISLPQKLQGSINIDVRELPKQAAEGIRSIDVRDLPRLNLKPKAIVDQAKSFSSSATDRASKAYVEFTKVGEKTLKKLRNGKKSSAKKTTAKVKATTAKKPAEANGAAATDTAASTTSQN